MGVIDEQSGVTPMTPLQRRRIQQLIDQRQYDKARELLGKLTGDKEAQAMLEDMAITYPVTRLEKGAKAANKIVFYVLLAITLFMVGAVIFGAIWMRIPR
jgi:chemotaxis methyl-accepting protein methylase